MSSRAPKAWHTHWELLSSTLSPHHGTHYMRVLLTGGYGCIGSWIRRNLLERGDQVWIYDLKEDPRRLRLILPEEKVKKVQFVQGDVTDLARLRDVFAAERISHVVHLAGLQV